MASPKSKSWILPAAISVIGFVGAIVFASLFPAVESLGTKVRLPVFHGAMTWANLVGFVALLIVAALYLMSKKDVYYSWSEALRWAVTGIWVFSSVLGFMAAMATWDFTGSQTPVFELLLSDPRLVVQLIISFFGLAMVVLPLLVETKKGMALADVVFALFAWGTLLWAMNAGKALHPDSPVMNSDEILIKVIFFCMVLAHLVSAAGLVSAIVAARSNKIAKLPS